MKRKALRARITSIESKRVSGDALLVFPNGSTRVVYIASPLRLLVAGFARQSAAAQSLPFPQSPLDPLLDLMANATDIKDQDVGLRNSGNLYRMILEAAHTENVPREEPSHETKG